MMDNVASHFARGFQKPGTYHIQNWVACLCVQSLSSLGVLGSRGLGTYLYVQVLEASLAYGKRNCFPAHQQQRNMVLHDLNLGFKCLALAPALILSIAGNTFAAETVTSLTSVQNPHG